MKVYRVLFLNIEFEVHGPWSGSCNPELADSQISSLHRIVKTKEVLINRDRSTEKQNRQCFLFMPMVVRLSRSVTLYNTALHTPSSSLPSRPY